MKELIQAWFRTLPAFPGQLAAGVRFGDQEALSRPEEGLTDISALEHAWRCTADAFRVMKIHRLPTRRLRWQFSEAVLHAVRRDDDHLLLLLVRPDAAEVDMEALETRVREFLDLRLPEGASPGEPTHLVPDG